MVGYVSHTAGTVGQSAVEPPSVELWARVPVGGISVEAHEQLHMTKRPEAELVERHEDIRSSTSATATERKFTATPVVRTSPLTTRTEWT